MKISANAACPCHSGKKYKKCCKIYHQNVLAKDAKTLMQSRYSAFALGDSAYIMKTTHPQHPEYKQDKKSWSKQIQEFTIATEFVSLDILEFTQEQNRAYVTFKAGLRVQGEDAGFTERSYFKKENGRWLYHSGEIQ